MGQRQAAATDVIYYNLPPAVVIQLGAAPAGHRYVRVASDILLIAVGTEWSWMRLRIWGVCKHGNIRRITAGRLVQQYRRAH